MSSQEQTQENHMLFELFPFIFSISVTSIAGWSLWSLGLYIALLPVADWLMGQLVRWFNFAERSLYQSQKEFDETQAVRESVNGLYASISSITPFLILGAICNYGVELHLGSSWAISAGLIACGVCALWELGRRRGQLS